MASRTQIFAGCRGRTPTSTTPSRRFVWPWPSSLRDDPELTKAQAFLRGKVEEWIPIILAAQNQDGYIHSFHVLNSKPRFTAIGDHEFYVMGYFLEMGVAHYRMSGGRDRRLYDAASRCADLLCDTFGPAPKRTWKNGHPGLEHALCRLGVLVNEAEGAGKGDKYVALAKHFLDHQHELEPNAYNQSDRPAVEMSAGAGPCRTRHLFLYSDGGHRRAARRSGLLDRNRPALDQCHPAEALPHGRRGCVAQGRGLRRRLRASEHGLLRVVRRLWPEFLGRTNAPPACRRPLLRRAGARAAATMSWELSS